MCYKTLLVFGLYNTVVKDIYSLPLLIVRKERHIRLLRKSYALHFDARKD